VSTPLKAYPFNMSVGLRIPRLEVSKVESSEMTEDLWLLPPLMLPLLKHKKKVQDSFKNRDMIFISFTNLHCQQQ